MTKPVWSRDELMLVLRAFLHNNKQIPDPGSAVVATLLDDLSVLSCNRASGSCVQKQRAAISSKFFDFHQLDASQDRRSSYANQDALQLWDEYSSRLPDLEQDCAVLLASRSKWSLEPLKTHVHALRLLGDQLVGNVQLAVFELVKNSYDADATKVSVSLDLDADEPSVIVHDNGRGMGIEQIRNGWLHVASPLKRGTNKSESKFGRTPLGEKGIGRLAAFKLGDSVEMTTRKDGESFERVVSMSLSSLAGDADSSISDVRVLVEEREPLLFGGDKSGTRIVISSLSNVWSKRAVRDLYRMTQTLVSPFRKLSIPKALAETSKSSFKDKFLLEFDIVGRQEWIEDLLDANAILERSVYRFNFYVDSNAGLRWKYEFQPPLQLKSVNRRKSDDHWHEQGVSTIDRAPAEGSLDGRPGKGNVLFTSDDLKGIGPISGSFFVFDRSAEIFRLIGEKRQITQFLNEQSGVRIYRDGMRVYNYGESGDDWLGLNMARVNKPGLKMASRDVVGAIELDVHESCGLQEKTNREGFDQNDKFMILRELVNSVIDKFNRERLDDRRQLASALKKSKSAVDGSDLRFEKTLADIVKVAEKAGISQSIEPKIDALKTEYNLLKKVVLGAASSINLAIIFHEADKQIAGLVKAIEKEESIDLLKKLAGQLSSMLRSFRELVSASKQKEMKISTLLHLVVQFNGGRFSDHDIEYSCPVLTGEDPDFVVTGAEPYYLSALSNLIDNAIYWLRRAREERGSGYTPALSLRTSVDWAAEGPTVAVIDNGTGFLIDPDVAKRPFLSGRNGGMGLGLYFADMVMESQGGSLQVLTDPSDLDLPSLLPGAAAAVVLVFAKSKGE